MAGRRKDKIERYIDRIISKYNNCSIIEGEKSRYYTVNGRTLRVSDHIGANSSGNISIIIPGFGNENGYIVHAHTSGAISIVDYEKVKEIVRSFFYMSSIMMELVQESVKIEVEKRDRFNQNIEVGNLKKEIDRLKKYEERCKAHTDGTVFGIPREKFDVKHLQAIDGIVRKMQKEGKV